MGVIATPIAMKTILGRSPQLRSALLGGVALL
jgi:hypothetical protein